MEDNCSFKSAADVALARLVAPQQLILDADTMAVRKEWRALFIDRHFRKHNPRSCRLKISESQFVILFDWNAVIDKGSINNPAEIEDAFIATFRTVVTSYPQCSKLLLVSPDFRGVHQELFPFARDIILRRLLDPYWRHKISETSKNVTIYGWPETWPMGEVL